MDARRLRTSVAAAATLLLMADSGGAFAVPLSPLPDVGTEITPARAGGGRGGRYVGGRPGGYHGGYHGGYRGGYRGGYHGGYRGGWRRPYYGWGPGGAIAAGAAIGVLTAATAAAYASSAAPAPGLCWYYTDATYRAGFWDNCP